MESSLVKTVKEKILLLQTFKMSWIEAQFLEKAKDILRACRTTMKYTYVFAFYLQKCHQQDIFEDNQKVRLLRLVPHARCMHGQYIHPMYAWSIHTPDNLEFVVESLSGLLEKVMPLNQTEADVQKFKQEVLDKGSYCESRRQKLLDHVQMGWDENLWEFKN
ncbi:hypothetical protein SARC_03787 [Sphaeroforma arctica JP610]|uniref:Uncharacterized protein n=1 Tax=Sphaeroforma arctica JP610 TaxID=667725 RepID=A0A0L0G4E6_9EUKA|nr:hypothetical protein SARC_03787 [Sphaeroforma arctica JP610]KNC83967.1 hypothetical protein SARC_03787 [Sphaeroforma arctica JP610]|eukprot:XP_014157869.1 hypothetical protein SARC_03787 [Sphaeroforma arctica JP610]